MSVYVDSLVKHPPAKDPQARRVGARNDNQWCHLFCDPGEEEKLHALAARIGMRREWFQAPPNASKPHYDLTPSRRAVAVQAGAVELDRDGLRAFFARWREHQAMSRPGPVTTPRPAPMDPPPATPALLDELRKAGAL